MLFDQIIHENVVNKGDAVFKIIDEKGGSIILSYAEFIAKAYHLRDFFASQGIKPNDKVALPMETSLETLLSIVALLLNNSIVVPLVHVRILNKNHNWEKISTAIDTVKPTAIIVNERTSVIYQSMVEQYNLQSLNITKNVMDGLNAEYSYDGIKLINCPENLAIIQFSSGSTSNPKGICLSHKNIANNLQAMQNRLFKPEYPNKIAGWLPLFHDMGLFGLFLNSVYSGHSLTLSSARQFILNPLSWLEMLSEEKATTTAAPQFAYNLCINKAEATKQDFSNLDLSHIDLMLNGGEYVDIANCEKFAKIFSPFGLRDNVIQPAYGLAENCVGVSCNPPLTKVKDKMIYLNFNIGQEVLFAENLSEKLQRVASSGIFFTNNKVEIRNNDNQNLPNKHVGYIYIKGPATTNKILTKDSENIYAEDEGVNTGDIGMLMDNELYILGRQKEVIKRAGETYFPSDIENYLIDKLAMQASTIVVVGYELAYSNNCQLKVFVKLNSVSTSKLELFDKIKFLLLRQYGMKEVDVYFVSFKLIPKTSSGKIQRTTIVSKLLAGDFDEYKFVEQEEKVDYA